MISIMLSAIFTIDASCFKWFDSFFTKGDMNIENADTFVNDFNTVTNNEYGRLLQAKGNKVEGSPILHIHDGVAVLPSGVRAVYPTATITDSKLLDAISITSLHNLLAKNTNFTGLGYTYTIRMMNAGTGTSIERTSHLKKWFNRTTIGAKGTDLAVNVDGKMLSLAQLKYLRLLFLSQKYHEAKLIIDDVVGPETKGAMLSIWEKPINNGKKLETVFRDAGIERGEVIYQSVIKNLDMDGNPTDKRYAPGGHALFGFQVLYDLLHMDTRPTSNHILIIANGEDVSGIPPLEIGVMMKEHNPIVMVTTDKTKNDLKGGQFALYYDDNNRIHYTLLETVQSKAAGQLDLFEEIGISIGERKALFNTNIVAFHLTYLYDILQRLKANGMTNEEILVAAMPDVIKNKKKTNLGEFVQVEGALGSLVLNLNSLIVNKLGNPIVSFLNIPANERVNYFAPVKAAWDHYYWFYSDRFKIDPKTHALIDNSKEDLPQVAFKGAVAESYYKDVENMLAAFTSSKNASLNTKVKDLKSLNVEGIFNFVGTILYGDLKLVNKTDVPINLAAVLQETTYIKHSQTGSNEKLKFLSFKDWNISQSEFATTPVLGNMEMEFERNGRQLVIKITMGKDFYQGFIDKFFKEIVEEETLDL